LVAALAVGSALSFAAFAVGSTLAVTTLAVGATLALGTALAVVTRLEPAVRSDSGSGKEQERGDRSELLPLIH
jgi:hypothetical protein